MHIGYWNFIMLSTTYMRPDISILILTSEQDQRTKFKKHSASKCPAVCNFDLLSALLSLGYQLGWRPGIEVGVFKLIT